MRITILQLFYSKANVYDLRIAIPNLSLKRLVRIESESFIFAESQRRIASPKK